MEILGYCEWCKTRITEENARTTREGKKIKTRCRPCYEKKLKNGESNRFKEQLKELNRKRREELAQKLGSQCQKCGYDKCLSVLQFHHRESEKKEMEIHSLHNNTNWFRAQEEVEKCDLLCANCHTEVHLGL